MKTPLRRSLHRPAPALVLGGDRELVMLSGLGAFLTALGGFSLAAAACGLSFWLVALFWLRKWAKKDPLLRPVWLRHIQLGPRFSSGKTRLPVPGKRGGSMLDLLHFHRSIKGLSDLLPYSRLVAEGVVANKDGSLSAAWEFKGGDTASSTMGELDFVAAQANQAVLLLGTGWMLHIDAVRRPATSYPAPGRSHFPDKVSRLIDEERRAFFSRATCFEVTTILTLTYKPERSLAASLLTDRKTEAEILKEFQSALDNFENILSGVLKMSRLGEYRLEDSAGIPRLYSSLLAHLQHCLTGDFQPVRVPEPCAMYLDGIIGS